MLKHLRISILIVVAVVILMGFVFPMVITGLAQVAFPRQAQGSLIREGGKVIGSDLIGQTFTSPRYFHPRPSAAGSSGYDATSSGGTNLGPTSDKLINGVHKKLPNGRDDPGNFDGIKDLAEACRRENGLPPNAPLPADAVTRSGSGLDPHISPAYAALQAPRVARARRLGEEKVKDLVRQNTEPRQFGLFGEPRVNVLRLNMALDQAR
jgi:K+-transporting ATPase ATPase C chain